MHWRSLAAAIATISAVGAAIGLGIPLLSVLLESRGYSASLIGANTAVAGLASIAAAPLAAPIAARLGVVKAILLMLLIGGGAFLGFHFLQPLWAWFALRVMLHFALTVLFVLSEYWINASAPPEKRGLVLGIYSTSLSLGFALGPWLFSKIGSTGGLPFYVGFAIIMVALIPVLVAWRDSPDFEEGEHVPFLPFIFAVPTATMAVFVFGAVETGGFALFPVFGTRVGYSEADAALLLTMIGLGNVLMQIPTWHCQRPYIGPAQAAFVLRHDWPHRHDGAALPHAALVFHGRHSVPVGRRGGRALYGGPCASGV